MVSTRRSQSTKKEARVYKVGDCVEVLRSEGVAVGTLLYKVARYAESPSSTSSKDHVGVDHWMVSIGDVKEDISERMMGRIVIQSDATVNNSTNHHNSGNSKASLALESDGSTSVVQKKLKNNGNKNNNLGGKHTARSSRNSSPRTAARPSTKHSAEKIPRKNRQAVKVKPQLPPPADSSNINNRVHTTRAATRNAGSTVSLFRGIEDMVVPAKKQQPKVSLSKSKNDGSVVKVQMLTGVLYLYRDGGKRHARFVRTK